MNLTFDPSLWRRAALLILLATLMAAPSQADFVVDWNRYASDVLVADTTSQNPGMASRTMAMVNLAMYDAINGVSPRHQPFYSHPAANSGANADAAGIEAAYQVLSSIYPGESSYLDGRRSTAMAAIPDGPAKLAGVSYGQTVANQIVATRSNDGFDHMVNYLPNSGPGHWQPDPLNPTQQAWGPQWGALQPFGITNTTSMIPPAMPDLTSQAYADAFNEVKELGSLNSATRTAEQTATGYFWAYDRLGMGTPMRMYNAILRNLAESQGGDSWDHARMFAMATTAMADAGIVAWDSKFTYDFWRPVTGIRRADEDNNPLTVADPSWEPLGAPGGIGPNGETINDFTPPFPTYVSGHASFGGAMFSSLENFFATDEMTFQVTSDEMPGMVRTYDRFSDAMAENGRSRVYLGIHWNFDDLEARTMGDQVADFLSGQYFYAVPEPSGLPLLGLFVIGYVIRRRRSDGRGTMNARE